MKQVKKLIDTAKALDGDAPPRLHPRRRRGHHQAAGVRVRALAKNDDAVVCQYVMTTLEELGLLKMDFLGLRNLTILDDTVRLVQKSRPSFSLADIPDNDPAVFQMLSEAGPPACSRWSRRA